MLSLFELNSLSLVINPMAISYRVYFFVFCDDFFLNAKHARFFTKFNADKRKVRKALSTFSFANFAVKYLSSN